MLYASVAKTVFNVTLHAGIQEVSSLTLALQAVRKLPVEVKLQTRPISPNPYELRHPMPMISATAGMTALALLPNAAMPAGIAKTPAPTMDLTKLKTSCEILAVPPPVDDEEDGSRAPD
jgi:hypothetical protein